jgi:hypothetical protein
MLKRTGQYTMTAAPRAACSKAPASGDWTPTWKTRKAALGAFALIVGLSGCGGSDDDPDPAPAPIAAPGPAPAPAPAPGPAPAPAPPGDPTPAGFVKTGDVLAADTLDVGDRYVKDAREVVFDSTGNKYYEFVPAPATWDAAQAAAVAAGGYLAVLSSPLEMLFVNQAYDGLGGPDGVDGTWVGATQVTGATAPGEGWTWVDGSALAADSELWNDEFGGLPLDSGLPEDGQAQYGAIYNGQSSTDTKLLYDNGTAAGTLPKYLIEYDSQAAIK